MINSLSYDEILQVSNELKTNADILNDLLKDKSAQELHDFISTVEGYSKFLETTVELQKDADEALSYLLSQKK